MAKPDFFIIGGPKCGTTALNDYLAEHAHIYIPDEKEINFFCSDMDARMRTYHTVEEYEAIFDAALPGQIIGEASVWHLFSRQAIQNILVYNPNAKIIAMLRNPMDMAYSLYNQNILNMKDDIEDFEAAWDAMPERRAGKNIPAYCPDPSTIDYERVCSLGRQVDNLLQYVPEDQLMIIFYDDFKNDTSKVYRDVLYFLGVPDDGRTDFEAINVSSKARSKILQRILRDPPPPLSWIWPAAKKTANRLGLRPAVMLEKINRKPHRRPPLQEAMKDKMREAFRDDVAHLSSLLKRDLSHWLEKR